MSASSQTAFVSLIRIDGLPIPIAPWISPEDRNLINEWRKQAVLIEEKLALRRQQVSTSLQKSRSQNGRLGAIPARSANFEERPQSRSVSGEQVVRKALTSAAYNDERTLADMLHKVALNDESSQPNDSCDENGVSVSSRSVHSGQQIQSASSTDLEPYLSRSSSSSSEESAETVRPETSSADGSVEPVKQQTNARSSYTIETPSSALLQQNQSGDESPSEETQSKPQFGHLGSMVAKYLTEQQRAKNLSEFAKLQSILQESSATTRKQNAENNARPVAEQKSPTKKVQIVTETSPTVAGIKRRHDVKLKSPASASDIIVAASRSYLVRRVMQTQKVQHWIQTIRDCQRLLSPDGNSATMDWRSFGDSRFREQVESQLEVALSEFHNIMFEWPLSKRIQLISLDNMPRGATPKAGSARPAVKPRVSPAVAAAVNRGRSHSTSSLQPNQPKNIDMTKRRRMGAVTPPKAAPSRVLATRVLSSNRPATSAGAAMRSRSPAVGSGVASGSSSPRDFGNPAKTRPNTAAPAIASKRVPTEASAYPQPVPPSVSSNTSRRSTVASGRR